MNTPTKVAKEAGITLFGEIYCGFSRFLFIGLLSRWVGPELLGIYGLAMSATRITGVVATLGLDRGVLRFVSHFRGLKENERAANSVASALKVVFWLAVLFATLQIGIAPSLNRFVFREQSLLVMLLVFFALSMPFGVMANVMGFATQGFKLMKYKVAVSMIIQPTVMIGSLVFCFLFLSKTQGVIFPVLVAEFVGFIVIWFFLKRLTGVGFTRIKGAAFDSELLRYSYPLMFMTVVSTLMHGIDILMLGVFLDSESVGLYLPAVRTMTVIRMFLAAFGGIFAPMISELYARRNFGEMSALYRLVFRWILTLALPMAVILVIFPDKIMLLFGAQYLPGREVIHILTFGVLLQSVTGISSALLVMTGRTKLNLFNVSLAASINIILNIILIPRFGLVGAAWGTMGAMIVLSLVRIIECRFVLKMIPFQRKLWKPLFATGLTAGFLLYLRPLISNLHTVVGLSIAVSAAFMIYGLIIFLLRLDQDDMDVLRSFKGLFRRTPTASQNGNQ